MLGLLGGDSKGDSKDAAAARRKGGASKKGRHRKVTGSKDGAQPEASEAEPADDFSIEDVD